VKRLLFRFSVFIGILYALERADIFAIAAGIGVVMAAIAFLHILTTPAGENPAPPQDNTPRR